MRIGPVVVAVSASFFLAAAAPGLADAPPPDFGLPPSGEVPILYNDHHVYTKPDILRNKRVLAALVRGNQILVPLRGMFEQMGATVSFDPAAKSVTATKPGVSVRVALGSRNVTINGESRPLDVPPMMFRGVLLVPVRVISEALGAYVQWLPNQRVVVIRYISPTPPPTPPPTPTPPTPAPTLPPTPAPTPLPTPRHYSGFAQIGLTHGKVYNEFSAGNSDLLHGEHELVNSYVAAGAILFDPWAVKVDFRQDEYCTASRDPCDQSLTSSFATLDGGTASIPQFRPFSRRSTAESSTRSSIHISTSARAMSGRRPTTDTRISPGPVSDSKNCPTSPARSAGTHPPSTIRRPPATTRFQAAPTQESRSGSSTAS